MSPATPLRPAVSAGSGSGAEPVVDSHVYVLDPVRFPYPAGLGYRPKPHEAGTVEDLLARMNERGIAQAVVVQPSIYGDDPRPLLHALEAGRGRLRGVLMLPLTTRLSEMLSRAGSGVVGVRINAVDHLMPELATTQGDRFLEAVAGTGWFMSVHARPEHWSGPLERLLAHPVPLVVEHYALWPGRAPRPSVLDRLAARPKTYVKLSCPFRMARDGVPVPDADLAGAVAWFLDAFGADRLVWGSGWPFINTRVPVDDAALLATLRRQVPGPVDRHSILSVTPSVLFGFAAARAGEPRR